MKKKFPHREAGAGRGLWEPPQEAGKVSCGGGAVAKFRRSDSDKGNGRLGSVHFRRDFWQIAAESFGKGREIGREKWANLCRHDAPCGGSFLIFQHTNDPRIQQQRQLSVTPQTDVCRLLTLVSHLWGALSRDQHCIGHQPFLSHDSASQTFIDLEKEKG